MEKRPTYRKSIFDDVKRPNVMLLNTYSPEYSKKYTEVKVGGHTLDHRKFIDDKVLKLERKDTYMPKKWKPGQLRNYDGYAVHAIAKASYSEAKCGGHALDHVLFVGRGQPSRPMIAWSMVSAKENKNGCKICGTMGAVMILPCNHVYCQACCRVRNEAVKCTRCRQVATYQEKQHNYGLMALKNLVFQNCYVSSMAWQLGALAVKKLTYKKNYRECFEQLANMDDSALEAWNRRVKYVYSPSKLLQYEFVKSLGSGNFGNVFLVKKHSKFVVLKESDFLQEAVNEINILQKLRHPNIIRIQDFFVQRIGHRTYSYMEMEYCKGGDLHQQIKVHGSLSTSTVVHVLGQLIKALIYMHGKGIIHRDLKPANVLFTDDTCSTVKLADMGVSTVLKPTRLKTYHTVGTPAFIAPEARLLTLQSSVLLCIDSEVERNASHSKNNYDERADIWSLGAICYSMLTGICQPENLATRSGKLLNSLAYFIDALTYFTAKSIQADLSNKSAPRELEWLVLKLLHPSPVMRMTLYTAESHVAPMMQRYPIYAMKLDSMLPTSKL